MTLGSRDSVRLARPGHSAVPRSGLLLTLGVALAVIPACIEQPLVAVERVSTKGGSSNSHGSGTDGGADEPGVGGKGNASGGSSGTGASGQDGGTSTEWCVAKPKLDCTFAACCKGMLCQDRNRKCCQTVEGSCREDSDCCDGTVCSTFDYTCRTAPTCSPRQIRCSEGEDCCSGRCDSDEDGVKRCQALEGCKPIGEAFTDGWEWECCSGIHSSSVCLASGYYKGPGETCGESVWQPGLCFQGTKCSQSLDGVPRCRLQECAGISQDCNHTGDCCSAGSSDGKKVRCAKRAEPPTNKFWLMYGTCQSCQLAGQPCALDNECCDDEGLVCRNGSCLRRDNTSTSTACVPLSGDCDGPSTTSGGSSSGASVCCTGLACDTKTSKCVDKLP